MQRIPLRRSGAMSCWRLRRAVGPPPPSSPCERGGAAQSVGSSERRSRPRPNSGCGPTDRFVLSIENAASGITIAERSGHARDPRDTRFGVLTFELPAPYGRPDFSR